MTVGNENRPATPLFRDPNAAGMVFRLRFSPHANEIGVKGKPAFGPPGDTA